MADAKRKLMIEILSDAKGVKKGFGEAEQASGGFGKKLVGLAAATGVVAIGADIMKDAMQGAIQDEASRSALEQQIKSLGGLTSAVDGSELSYKDATKSIEKWIDKTSLAVGIADDELRPAMAQQLRATKDQGVAEENLQLAIDISAAKHISLAEASDLVAKAQNGNTKGLKSLGISLKDADGNALGLDETFTKLHATFDGAGEAAANTGEGKLRKMTVAFDEMKEKLGTALLPIMEKLVDWITVSLIPAIETAVKWIQENFPKGIKVLQDAFDKVWPIIENVVKQVEGVFKIIKGVFDVFADIFHGDWKKLWEDLGKIFEGVKDLITGVIGQFWEELKLLAETAGKAMLNAWLAGMQSVWDNILYPWFVGIPLKILDAVKDANLWLLGKGKDVLLGLVHGLESGISDVFTWFFNLPVQIKNWLLDAGKWLFDVGKGVARGFWDGIKAAWNSFADIATFKVPKVHIPGTNIDFGGNTISLLPHLAKGIENFAGGLAVVGERGAEIVNLPRGSNVYPNGTGPGGGTVNNYITINATDPDSVIAAFKRYTQQNGSGWMVA